LNLDDVKGVGLFRSDEGKTAWVVGVDEVAATAVDHIPLPGQRPVDDDRAAGARLTSTSWTARKLQPIATRRLVAREICRRGSNAKAAIATAATNSSTVKARCPPRRAATRAGR
jgi:hypothetical protein